jgi:uncharacterized protein YjbJ (UPF0337 family)
VNQADFEGTWHRMRGDFKKWWGSLTDADLDQVAGQYDRLIGLLQEKYGYRRERAEQELTRKIALRRDERVEAEFARRLAALAARQRQAVRDQQVCLDGHNAA